MDELQGIVDIMLEEIENKLDISKASFKLWFADFKLLSLDDKGALFPTKTETRRKMNSKTKSTIFRTRMLK